jgi:hypothetical protein
MVSRTWIHLMFQTLTFDPTSGDRISNFIWQIAYSELYVTPTFGPISKRTICRPSSSFQRRRRFGELTNAAADPRRHR